MHAKLTHPLADTAAGATAEAVLRACVHCGMCNAVCPTYQLTGDERDGPRGRITLMKGALEGAPVGRESQIHLDRCLSCRACERACPSGVEYHRLLDVGREAIGRRVRRPWPERLARAAIREVCTRPAGLRFGAAAASLMAKRAPTKPEFPAGGRRMLLLRGCVQSVAAPHFNRATRQVFGRAGIALAETRGGSCCGALDAHLDAPDRARHRARRNIEAWSADLSGGAEAIVVNASGCAAFIRDYPDLLADDRQYRDRARDIAAAVRDPVEVLRASFADGALKPERAPPWPRIAVHDPCTLANGPGLGGAVAELLASLGYRPEPTAAAPKCCGSAGAWSLLRPAWARVLRDDMLATLTAAAPQQIVTANIGCWLHLRRNSPVPVRHWIEAVAEVLE